jgi:ribonuclease E
LLDKFFSWFKPAHSDETKENTQTANSERMTTSEKGASSSQDRNKKNARGRNRPRSRGDRKNNASTKQSLNDSVEHNADNSEAAAGASFPLNEETAVKSLAQADAQSLQQTQNIAAVSSSEESGVIMTAGEDGGIFTEKPDDKKRARRRRSPRQKDRSAHSKSVESFKEDSTDYIPPIDAAADRLPIASEPVSVAKLDSIDDSSPVAEEMQPRPLVQQDNERSAVKPDIRVADQQHSESKTTINPEINSERAFSLSEAPAAISVAKSSEEISGPSGEVFRQSPEKPDLKESGLVMIETPPEKIELSGEEQPPLKRRPRRKVKSVDEPGTDNLTQIETRE